MTPNPLQSKKKKKILIIEDEGDMCLLLNILLDGKNMTLDHVKDLARADEYLRKEQPDIILMDNKLPDGFGIDFIPFVRQNNPGSKIIMISGFDASARDVALDNGADLFLEKPFSKDQLYSAVRYLLEQKEQEVM